MSAEKDWEKSDIMIVTYYELQFIMSDFWKNIARYPRFFISSLLGLIFVILTPVRNLFKIKKLRFILPILICGILILLYLVIANMVAL